MIRMLVVETTTPEGERWVKSQEGEDWVASQPDTTPVALTSTETYSLLRLYTADTGDYDDKVLELHPGVIVHGPDSETGRWASEEWARRAAIMHPPDTPGSQPGPPEG